VVRRLRDAGASVLGKTNLDQFACGLNGTRSPYGAVPNAFDPALHLRRLELGVGLRGGDGQADFALGTDTAGSGRVPAGLNNIVGLKPSAGLISARGVVPAAQSVDCVSIFAGTVGLAARVLRRRMGPTCTTRIRAARAGRRALPARFRFGVPDRLQFFGDALARAAFRRPSSSCATWAARRSPSTTRRSPQAAALLYDSALVAERYAAIRSFFDGREADVMEPVRSIIGAGCGFSAADLCERRPAARARPGRRGDVGRASTCCWCRPRPRTTRSRRCRPTRWR
jgi:allophanate hydrolase